MPGEARPDGAGGLARDQALTKDARREDRVVKVKFVVTGVLDVPQGHMEGEQGRDPVAVEALRRAVEEMDDVEVLKVRVEAWPADAA